MINKNTANKLMKTPIRAVVPQPGNTLPASEFKGRNKVPNGVTIPESWKEACGAEALVLAVAIIDDKISLIFYFL